MHLRLAAFRYHPVIGGAENHARRLLSEFGSSIVADVISVVDENRTDWLRSLIGGARTDDRWDQVDGRAVRWLGRWSGGVRTAMWGLAPLYHLPASPVPTLMGRLLAPELDPAVRGADVVHNVFIGREAFSYGLMEAGHRLGSPFVFTPFTHLRPLGWNSPAFREIYRKADAVIAATAFEADWLKQRGARRDRVHVIGTGPLNDPASPPDLAWAALGRPRPFVLFLGQLHPYKGYRAVLEAASRLTDLRDVQFVFAGPDVGGHAREFEGAGANVRYLGRVSPELKDSLLRACSVLCVPSSRESFGIVVVEAWLCGKPVIGGPAAATRELIEDGRDGWALDQDGEQIARHLRELLEDPARADAMGACGAEKVARKYAWAAIAAAHLEVYRSVV